MDINFCLLLHASSRCWQVSFLSFVAFSARVSDAIETVKMGIQRNSRTVVFWTILFRFFLCWKCEADFVSISNLCKSGAGNKWESSVVSVSFSLEFSAALSVQHCFDWIVQTLAKMIGAKNWHGKDKFVLIKLDWWFRKLTVHHVHCCISCFTSIKLTNDKERWCHWYDYVR